MTPHRRPSPTRRSILAGGSAAAFQALVSPTQAQQAVRRRFLGYGPLRSTLDERTGLPMLRLPWGFRYTTFSITDEPLTIGGGPTPGLHDGMGVVATDPSGVVTLIRNHELSGPGTSFALPGSTYDSRGRGGCTRLRFDTVAGTWLSSEAVLGGTDRSCSGGVTPWGSWLSCEESNDGPVDGFTRSHGWVFEVPATGAASPIALQDMGRFYHEAVCVDPLTSYVYLTEDDRYTSGFYRFRPLVSSPEVDLAAGGILEMLKVVGAQNQDMMLVTPGQTFPVEWVAIANPTMNFQSGVGPFGSVDGQTTRASGPFLQGFALGGARFRRLEGCWHDDVEGYVYFTDTEGGLALRGSLWRYDPSTETAEVVYVSPRARHLDKPDNVTVSPRGGILLCEDGTQPRERLQALSRQGELSVFAENDIEIDGVSFRNQEWAGCCFDPTGTWLFVNNWSPGITFAITGPWRRGPL